MITDSFIVYIRTDNISEDIAEDVKKRFETSNYELNRPKGKSQKVIGVMKDKSDGKIMKEFVGFRAKTYTYLVDDGSEDKKAKGLKSVSQKNFILKTIKPIRSNST